MDDDAFCSNLRRAAEGEPNLTKDAALRRKPYGNWSQDRVSFVARRDAMNTEGSACLFGSSPARFLLQQGGGA